MIPSITVGLLIPDKNTLYRILFSQSKRDDLLSNFSRTVSFFDLHLI